MNVKDLKEAIESMPDHWEVCVDGKPVNDCRPGNVSGQGSVAELVTEYE